MIFLLKIYNRIYKDPEEAVNNLCSKENKEYIIDRLKKLPSEGFPYYPGPRIVKLWLETYHLASMFFHNATICMCGVLLEALLKETIFLKRNMELADIVGKKNADFGRAISFCKKEGYISKDEAKWLEEIKDEIRNPYLHSNIREITEGRALPGWVIDSTPKDLRNKIESIQSGKIKPVKLTGHECRVIDDVLKGIIDEERSLPLFLEVDKFVRRIVKRHFKSI